VFRVWDLAHSEPTRGTGGVDGRDRNTVDRADPRGATLRTLARRCYGRSPMQAGDAPFASRSSGSWKAPPSLGRSSTLVERRRPPGHSGVRSPGLASRCQSPANVLVKSSLVAMMTAAGHPSTLAALSESSNEPRVSLDERTPRSSRRRSARRAGGPVDGDAHCVSREQALDDLVETYPTPGPKYGCDRARRPLRGHSGTPCFFA